MIQEIAATNMTGGIQFIWAISIGQIITIAIAVVGFLTGAGALFATVRSHTISIKALNSAVDRIETGLSELAAERHQETSSLRAELLQFRAEVVYTERTNAENLMIVRQVLKHLVEKINENPPSRPH